MFSYRAYLTRSHGLVFLLGLSVALGFAMCSDTGANPDTEAIGGGRGAIRFSSSILSRSLCMLGFSAFAPYSNSLRVPCLT